MILSLACLTHHSLTSPYLPPAQIRNIFTSHLPGSTVKHLLQLAGASSLSMKPPLALLTWGAGSASGPAVVIGVVRLYCTVVHCSRHD